MPTPLVEPLKSDLEHKLLKEKKKQRRKLKIFLGWIKLIVHSTLKVPGTYKFILI